MLLCRSIAATVRSFPVLAVLFFLVAGVIIAHGAEGGWRAAVTIEVLGDTGTIVHGRTFTSEEDCKVFLASREFYDALVGLARETVKVDPDAKFVTDPVCVNTGDPA